MKSLLLVCALMLAAVPVMAESGGQGSPAAKAQHDIDHDRTYAAGRDAAAAARLAAGNVNASQRATDKANTRRADISADLAGCPTCH